MSFLNKKRIFFIMVLPSLVLYFIYVVAPVFLAFRFSLTNFTGLGEYKFIGFGNYVRLLQDSYFHIALKNVGIMLVLTLVIEIPFSFMLALIVNMKLKAAELLKLIYIAPYILVPVVTGLIWTYIFDPTYGFINTLLRNIGLGVIQPEWIGGFTLTPYSAVIVTIWSTTGFYMAIFLAGIKMIPEEYYESSLIDGASKKDQMIYITIPLLYESSFKTVFVIITTSTIGIFDYIFILTNGGPNHSSETILSLMYNVTFITNRYGYGMAMAVFEFVLAFLVTQIVLKVVRTETTA